MANSVKFLKAFLANPRSIGAIAPSSRYLARAMVAGLQPGPDEVMVELGPGTGAFTGAIRETLAAPSGYLGIEIEPAFVELLRDRFPNLEFCHGSAENVASILGATRRGRVHAILSGLPFASLAEPIQDRILTGLEQVMAPGTTFRTFQYVHAYPLAKARRFRAAMSNRFGRCRASGIILRNLPPALVLSWPGTARRP